MAKSPREALKVRSSGAAPEEGGSGTCILELEEGATTGGGGWGVPSDLPSPGCPHSGLAGVSVSCLRLQSVLAVP